MEKVMFPGASGAQLAARIDAPAEPQAWAVFAHGFTLGKDLASAGAIARALSGAGVGMLRFDFTGIGSSEGEFSNTNFSTRVGDIVSAAKWLAENREAPRLLVGHSFGGAAVLAAAAQIPTVEAVATIGAPADPAHVEHLFEEKLDDISADGRASVVLGGHRFELTKQFLTDIESTNLLPKVRELDAALLVFHSPIDEVVGIEHARAIFEAARHPKSFIALDGADHLITRRSDAIYAGNVIAAWVGTYLD